VWGRLTARHNHFGNVSRKRINLDCVQIHSFRYISPARLPTLDR
jgi:hypothetical protein